MEMKLELVAVPVSDVDKAKAFYEQAGFVIDVDQRVNDELRFVQATPPGSACSIAFGQGITKATPGSLEVAVALGNPCYGYWRHLRLSKGLKRIEGYNPEDAREREIRGLLAA